MGNTKEILLRIAALNTLLDAAEDDLMVEENKYSRLQKEVLTENVYLDEDGERICEVEKICFLAGLDDVCDNQNYNNDYGRFEIALTKKCNEHGMKKDLDYTPMQILLLRDNKCKIENRMIDALFTLPNLKDKVTEQEIINIKRYMRYRNQVLDLARRILQKMLNE